MKHLTPEDVPAPQHLDDTHQYRLLAESIPHLAWIAEADGSIFWYNRRWYEYTGTTFEDMQGWGWQSVHDPARLQEVLLLWKASIQTGEQFEMTFPLRAADGSFRPFLTRSIPFKDAAGNVLRWFGTNTDISEQIRSAAALQQSEQRFRTATEAVNGILWTNNTQGEMQGDQPSWSDFTGQTPQEYGGFGWVAAVHPDDAQPTLNAWQQAVSASTLFSFEHRVRRRDGEYRLCSVRALPIRNEDGSVREWVGVHTDITEDRNTQQALRDTVAALKRQEELVEAAQITNNVGFWRLQPATGEMYLSSGARHLLGIPLTGELTVEEAFRQIQPEDVPRLRHALEDALESGHYQQEFRTTNAAGEHRHILGVARMLHSEDGSPYLVGMNLDITQQKRSAEALIRTEKLAVAGRLAASIAHEINNPLEAITNLLYLLLQSSLTEEQTYFCNTMMSELQRVSEIATHTLRFHRQSTLPTHTDIEALVASVLGLFEGRVRAAGVTIASRFAPMQQVFGFDGELRQVLANLVGNAIDAMAATDPPRILTIRTHQCHNPRSGVAGVAIAISDTGTGMSPDTLAHLFEPFFTTKGEVGTGLGLWVSNEIIQRHHGQITVKSGHSPRHHGSVFRIFLPFNPPS